MSHIPVLGGELLRLVTSGMYENPLDLYREYVQNAADATAVQRRNSKSGSVRITIDTIQSKITILDDGTGIEPTEAVQRLIDLGHSPKDPSVDRGFRGIGRLSALAYADVLHFTTRSRADDPPVRVSWNAKALRALDVAHIDSTEVIQRCVTTTQVPEGDWPARFFQVTIDRVNRHAKSTLLNVDAVRNYIGEVCPVPIALDFPLANEIANFLTEYTNHLTLDIRINEDEHPIVRPFKDSIPLTKNFDASFDSLETRIIPGLDTDVPSAVLWLAHTSYSGSISRQLGIRGLRARIGNLQIGTDRIFEHLFLEPRFNGWCVGEIHILDKHIVPTGRRYYFESGPHLRNLENHIGAVAQDISLRCRRASSQRNKLRGLSTNIQQVKCATQLVCSGLLDERDTVALVARERTRISDIRKTLSQLDALSTRTLMDELAHCEEKIGEGKSNRKTTFFSVSPRTRSTLQAAFGAIVQAVPPENALRLIESILQNVDEVKRSPDSVPSSRT